MVDAALAGPAGRVVEAAVAGGVDQVQVRDRTLDGAALFDLAATLRAAAVRGAARRRAPVRVIVNRRSDVALALPADGVHLGFDAVTPAQARTLLGPDAWIGISAHDVAEISAESGASYAHLAPIHAPRSKPATRPSLGARALEAASRRGVPVFAQGGIDAARARDAVAQGAAGVAVTGAIALAEDPERAARALREALDERLGG